MTPALSIDVTITAICVIAAVAGPIGDQNRLRKSSRDGEERGALIRK